MEGQDVSWMLQPRHIKGSTRAVATVASWRITILECKVTCKGDLEWRYVDTTYEWDTSEATVFKKRKNNEIPNRCNDRGWYYFQYPSMKGTLYSWDPIVTSVWYFIILPCVVIGFSLIWTPSSVLPQFVILSLVVYHIREKPISDILADHQE